MEEKWIRDVFFKILNWIRAFRHLFHISPLNDTIKFRNHCLFIYTVYHLKLMIKKIEYPRTDKKFPILFGLSNSIWSSFDNLNIFMSVQKMYIQQFCLFISFIWLKN